MANHYPSSSRSCVDLSKFGNSYDDYDFKSKNSLGKHNSWTLSDAQLPSKPKLPLQRFDHMAREVISLQKSLDFYCNILGFDVIPRPSFECEGYWLYGYGLALHLVASNNPQERKQVKLNRIKHFSESLPRVDHFAFSSTDLEYVKKTLDDAKVFYKEDKPAGTGIHQIFLFDPDGNVIEISNCSLKIGEVKCNRDDTITLEIKEEQHPLINSIPSIDSEDHQILILKADSDTDSTIESDADDCHSHDESSEDQII